MEIFMNFKDILDGYINQLDCTMKELAEESTLSPSALSRYRMGKRVPAKNSEQLTKLASGLAILAQRKGLTSLTYDAILESFRSSFKSDFNANDFAAKFDYILNELNINVSGMAKVMNYDASFLSRIRSGKRLPSNIDTFVHVFSEYVVKHNDTENVSDMLNHLLHKDFTLHNSEKELIETIYNWFLTGSYKPVNHATGFLQKVDEFNLDDYIRAIHFDNLKVPTMPFRLPTSKFYYGIEGQQKSELDFFKGTVLSKSPEPVFMCSDTDMTDMAKDSDFPKKWMFGLAMILKKGLDIHIIHNLNRPFYELMLGLEAWIPLYMTGQITPFYLKGIHNNVFQHLLYVSGSTALSGECIKGYHHQSRFYLTNGKEDMPYYKNRALALEKKALPLMDIYTQEQINRFTEFLQSNAYSSGKYHYISSSLPLFTLSNDFLLEILQKTMWQKKICQCCYHLLKHKKII